MKELTEVQKKIQVTLFKDLLSNNYFTVNVYNGVKTNSGYIAYPVIGCKMIYFHERYLLTAINKGECKKGIMYIKKAS